MNQETNTDEALNLTKATAAALEILQSKEPDTQSQVDELWLSLIHI